MRVAALKTSDGRSVARHVRFARSFWHRSIGLLGIPPLSLDEGLLLSPGGSIHTFGMQYSIDVVFLDRQLKILRLAPSVAPWRLCFAPRRTKHVLEMRGGTLQSLQLQRNAYLCVDTDYDDRKGSGLKGTPACSTTFRFSLRIAGASGGATPLSSDEATRDQVDEHRMRK